MIDFIISTAFFSLFLLYITLHRALPWSQESMRKTFLFLKLGLLSTCLRYFKVKQKDLPNAHSYSETYRSSREQSLPARCGCWEMEVLLFFTDWRGSLCCTPDNRRLNLSVMNSTLKYLLIHVISCAMCSQGGWSRWPYQGPSQPFPFYDQRLIPTDIGAEGHAGM